MKVGRGDVEMGVREEKMVRGDVEMGKGSGGRQGRCGDGQEK